MQIDFFVKGKPDKKGGVRERGNLTLGDNLFHNPKTSGLPVKINQVFGKKGREAAFFNEFTRVAKKGFFGSHHYHFITQLDGEVNLVGGKEDGFVLAEGFQQF